MAWWKKVDSLIEKHEVALGILLGLILIAVLIPAYSSSSTKNASQNKSGVAKKKIQKPKRLSNKKPKSKPSPNSTPAITTITTSDKKGENGAPSANTFSVTSVYSVYVYSHWKNIEGSHDEVVKFYCPDGELYQTVYVPFTTSKLSSMKKKPTWSPHEVDIILAPSVNGAHVVRAELPIAGTWAMRLTGSWKAKIFLDDNPNSFGEVSFNLTP